MPFCILPAQFPWSFILGQTTGSQSQTLIFYFSGLKKEVVFKKYYTIILPNYCKWNIVFGFFSFGLRTEKDYFSSDCPLQYNQMFKMATYFPVFIHLPFINVFFYVPGMVQSIKYIFVIQSCQSEQFYYPYLIDE